LASNEFVDLDEIVPGTGFSKKQDESVKKKEPSPQQQYKSEPIKEEPQKKEAPKEESQEEVPPQKKPEKKSEDSKKESLAKKEEKEAKVPKFPEKQEKVEEKKEKPVKPKISNDKKTSSKEIEHAAPAKRKIKKMVLIKKKERKIESKAVSSKKEKKEKKSNGRETNWTLIALLILAVIIIGVIVYMAVKFDFSANKEDRVMAVVNGQPIYKSEITERYNLLKSTLNPLITEENVLNLTITDKLLLQEAAKKGITTSNEEVSNLINEIMSQNNINEEELKKDLALKNVSYEFLVGVYKNTLTINKLVDSYFSNITVSDKEVREFYNENKDNIRIPDRVQVRHILFLIGNESEDKVYERAEEVFKIIKEDRSNFCGLVLEYTEDTGSEDFCGEYNFSADYPLLPEFLEAGFSMKPGEVNIIRTQLGYHIIYKVANIPGYVPELADVEKNLKPALVEEKTAMELNNLIVSLRNDAIIEVYNESITTKKFNEINAAETSQEDKSPEENPSEDGNYVDNMSQALPKGSNGELISDVSKEVLNTPKSKKMILANCLNDKGVRMFTASWSPDSKDQLALFDEYASSLRIVECDPESDGADLEECSKVLKKQYPTWPTWQIEEVLYEGIQSLGALSRYSGCPY